MKRLKRKDIFWLIIIGLCLFIAYDAHFNYVDWRTADRSSTHMAPEPQIDEAIVQVYTARTYNWRGYFAVHPWVAVKKKNEHFYTVYQVTGWDLLMNKKSVSIKKDIPDRMWYGRKPHILQTLRGETAENAIPKIEKAVESYPYADEYRLWPGPNSNTFVAHIIRNVPELTVELPSTAIGKDFLGYKVFHAKSPSGSGYQVSILGTVSLIVGLREGFELGVLGLSFGVDFYPPALKLPIIGRLGFKDI